MYIKKASHFKAFPYYREDMISDGNYIYYVSYVLLSNVLCAFVVRFT